MIFPLPSVHNTPLSVRIRRFKIRETEKRTKRNGVVRETQCHYKLNFYFNSFDWLHISFRFHFFHIISSLHWIDQFSVGFFRWTYWIVRVLHVRMNASNDKSKIDENEGVSGAQFETITKHQREKQNELKWHLQIYKISSACSIAVGCQCNRNGQICFRGRHLYNWNANEKKREKKRLTFCCTQPDTKSKPFHCNCLVFIEWSALLLRISVDETHRRIEDDSQKI